MGALQISRQFFDVKAGCWDDEQEDQRQTRIWSIMRQYDIDLPAPCLDVGSGTGVLIPLLKRINPNGNLLIEYDISAEMLRKARRKEGQHASLAFLQGDAHDLPLPSDVFASVVCFSVFPHFHDPVRAIREFRRVLRKNGVLFILHLMGHERLNQLHGRIGEAVKEHRLPDADNLAETLRQNAFKIEQVAESDDLYLIFGRKI